jgi:hypothetical protein
LLPQAGIFFSLAREWVPRIRGVNSLLIKAGKIARRKGRSGATFIFDIFSAKSRSDFNPEKGWSLKKGRGTQMPSLFLSSLSITRLMAPRRNTFGVEVFPEYFYSSLSSLRLPVARAFGARQIFIVTGSICRGLSLFMGLCVTRTAAGRKDGGELRYVVCFL